jgi:Short C-terminal domain
VCITLGLTRADAGNRVSYSIMIFIRFATLLATTALLGCASNPPVQPAASSKSQFDTAVYGGETAQLEKPTPSAEVYRAFYQGGTGFVSVSSVRETVEEMANKHCARKGQTVRPLQETTSKPPHLLGNFPRVEWLFECSALASSAAVGSPAVDKLGQLERLKKLLDSGALTQQEYEREKTKILGTQ